MVVNSSHIQPNKKNERLGLHFQVGIVWWDVRLFKSLINSCLCMQWVHYQQVMVTDMRNLRLYVYTLDTTPHSLHCLSTFFYFTIFSRRQVLSSHGFLFRKWKRLISKKSRLLAGLSRRQSSKKTAHRTWLAAAWKKKYKTDKRISKPLANEARVSSWGKRTRDDVETHRLMGAH